MSIERRKEEKNSAGNCEKSGQDGFGMKKYLDLVPVSARKRKRQSRMTRICIILAVFLVASIFSMADMEIQAQKQRTIQDYGSWHVIFRGLDEEQMRLIGKRPEVEVMSRYAVTNYRTDMGYTINGKETAVCGFDESFGELMVQAEVPEGRFPADETEAAFTQSVKRQLGVDVGDTVTLAMPDGRIIGFTVSGFASDSSLLTSEDAFGMFLNMEGYAKYFMDTTQSSDFELYVEFSPWCNIQRTISDICEQLGISRDSVQENTQLVALLFQTSDSLMQQLYIAAALLAVLVMTAGILMISSSMNSNVSQRTQFFGMMRCLGADTKQIRRYVRREALNWCRSAVPLGLILSLIMVWVLCAVLRFLSPYYFGDMPSFGISFPGLAAGAAVGVITVLLAARSPARQASRVSPLTAVSGNAGTTHAVKKAANTRLFRIETALGIHHASGSRKNFILMTGSFAFSIILFLSFSPAIDFMNHAIRPLQPSASDLSIISQDNTCSVSRELSEELERNPVVNKVYGRSYAYSIPARSGGENFNIQLISFEEDQFDWAKEDLNEGAMEEAEAGNGVLAVYMNAGRDFAVGEELTLDIGGEKKIVKVSGLLTKSMFDVTDESAFLICSEELFQELTGETDYTIIDVQFNSGVTDQDVEEIRSLAGENVTVSDNRMENSEAEGGYYSFALFLYGFLAVIALISVFNIINSIAMSVSARIREYGAMRAIGMSSNQMIRMVAAEAVIYVVWGSVVGCTAGIFLNYKIYGWLVTARWGTSWYIPAGAMFVILAVVIIAAAAAVHGPAKRIREMSIVDTISAL